MQETTQDTTKRDELRAELDKLGVKYHHMHKEDKLQELLDEAKSQDIEEEVDRVKETPEPTMAIVMSGSNMEVRRYTLETHGENFYDLAKEFTVGRGDTWIKLSRDEHKVCEHCGSVL